MFIRHYLISNVFLSSLWIFIFPITGSSTKDSYADSWGVTKINAEKISYLWTISNYSLNNIKMGESLESPIFSDDSNKYQWQLQLYLKGRYELEKNRVLVFIYLKNKANVTAHIEFSMKDGNGKKINSYSFTSVFADANTGMGRDNWISSSSLDDNTNLLPGDSLTLLVEIIVNEGITQMSGSCRFANNVSNSQHMSQLLESSFLSDVELRVNGHAIKAHRAILATHSSWFLQEFMKNPNLDVVNIENTTIAAVKQALCFMYTGKVEKVEIMAKELLALSNQLGIAQLKLICDQVLCKSMNSSNAIDILMLAELHDDANLEREVSKYIAAHAASIADSPGFENLEKLHPNPFYAILRTMINKKKI